MLALYGLGLLFIALSLVIAIWLPPWAGFLIMAVVLFIVTAILALARPEALNQVNPRPDRAIAQAQETMEAVQGLRRPRRRRPREGRPGPQRPGRARPAAARLGEPGRDPRGPGAHVTSVSLDAALVLIDGPWHHRHVSANGARFHVAELGDGPMVLLMHGFPQFWYTWRHQMVAIADAG